MLSQHKLVYYVLIVFVASLLINGCGGSRYTRKFKGVSVPPGVNPIVAVRADSLSEQLFVSMEDEIKAEELYTKAERHFSTSDSLWKIFDETVAKSRAVSPEDSLAALRETMAGYQQVQKSTPLVKEYVDTSDNRVKIQATYHLQEAEKSLLKALELNPLSAPARKLLAHVYNLLGNRFLDKTNYDRAIEIWERMVRLEPGEYQNYYHLAMNYFASGRYEQALENFENLEETLLASADISDQAIANPSLSKSAAIDSNLLFAASYYQAQCAIKTIDEDKAVSSLDEAYELAQTPEHQAAVQSYINWIHWDEGNIVAAVLRDSANTLRERGEFAKAAETYRKMLPNIRTDRARFETSANLAFLEFSELEQKPMALNRMQEVVEAIPKDTRGVPLDSARYQKYLNNFGTMCHNLGMELREIDRQQAYTYFMQSTEINWEGRGKSYLMMANLAAANPEQATKDAEMALELSEQLESEEVVELHKLLVNGYRKLRDYDKAREHIQKLRRLQQGASNGSSNN